MKKETREVWTTADGRVFLTERESARHELIASLVKILSKNQLAPPGGMYFISMMLDEIEKSPRLRTCLRDFLNSF